MDSYEAVGYCRQCPQIRFEGTRADALEWAQARRVDPYWSKFPHAEWLVTTPDDPACQRTHYGQAEYEYANRGTGDWSMILRSGSAGTASYAD